MKIAKIAFVLFCALIIGFSGALAASNFSVAEAIISECAEASAETGDNGCKTCTWECEGGGSGTTQTKSASRCATLCDVNCRDDGGCKSQSWGDSDGVFVN